MRKITSLLLALLMLVCAFAGCTNKTEEPETPDDGKSATAPLLPRLVGANATPEQTYSVAIWGDALICTNNFADVLMDIAAQDGIKLNIYGMAYNNGGKAETYTLYEMFNWTNDTATGEVTSFKANSAYGKKLQAAFDDTENPLDFMVILSGRERGIGLPAARGRVLTSIAYWENMVAEKAPQAKMVLFVPPAFKNGFSDSSSLTKWGLSTGIRPATHTQQINKLAEEMAAAMKNDPLMCMTSDATQFFYNTAKYADTGIDLHDSSKRHPSIAGSYYNACILYYTLFGKSTVGMPVYGQLSKEEAVILQNAAHEFCFGQDPSTYTRESATSLSWEYINRVDERFPDETYPENFDYLMATVLAYDERVQWLQYDQLALDRTSQRSIYRRTTEASPEDATPQSTLYMDCSSWLYACFLDAFDYEFPNGADRVNKLITCKDIMPYYWYGMESDETEEMAVELLLETIQPGDLIVYTDYADIGHVILYVGNGVIMHCSGDQAGGGGSDYSVDRKADSWEYSGGIQTTTIDDFINPYGVRYMYGDRNHVGILRPLETEGITPSENAKARLEGLIGIVAYKGTTAPEGVTVSAGSDVTFTFVAKNNNPGKKTVTITDTIPTGLTYKNGDGAVEGSNVTLTMTLEAGEEKSVSYTVTIDSNIAKGTLIENDSAYINGVHLNATPVLVGNTLSAEQQSGIMAKLETLAEGKKDTYALAAALYADMSYTLPFDNANDSMKKTFIIPEGKDYCKLVEEGDVKNLIAGNLFGGKSDMLSSNDPCIRNKGPQTCHLVAGDILVLNPDKNFNKCEMYIYAGNDIFVSCKDGKLTKIVGSSSSSLMESTLGNFCYAVLRPSLGF